MSSRQPHQRDYVGVSPYNFYLNAQARQTMAGAFGGSRSQQLGRRNLGSYPNGRHNVPLNFDVIDDVVLITIPRQTRQVRNHSRRNHMMIVLDDDSVVHQGRSGANNVEERTSTGVTLNDSNIHGRNLLSGGLSINSVDNLTTEINAKKEPIFTCAICLDPLMEETSTLCGHIFCKECIVTAIRVQRKCPTCRHDLTINSIHRVYLPTTS